IVLLIAISTIVLRYHYVADILTGFAIAFVADRVALRRFARPRLRAPRALFAALARAGVGLFFDRIDVEGSVPADGPLLLVANRERLASGGAVCIFPEGISHSDASMRELKAGAARIALDFAAAHEELRIVPVGLHYDAKQRFRSSVLVRFGEPIAIPADADARALTQLIDARIRA